jgi:hypothetical protein
MAKLTQLSSNLRREKMQKWFLGFTLVAILNGLVASQSSKMTVLDYVNVLSTKNQGEMIGFFVKDSNRPDVIDLKNDYVRYNGTFGRPEGAWDFTEVAVWRTNRGYDVVGVNYQMSGKPDGCGDDMCNPKTVFAEMKNGKLLNTYPIQKIFSNNKNYFNNLYRSISAKSRNPKRAITLTADSPWAFRYEFPRIGTTIKAYVNKSFFEIDNSLAYENPVFYLKYSNGTFKVFAN